MGNMCFVASRGTGLLALFCDLEPRWREAFRQWLKEDMFTARLAIGFRACASYDLLSAEGEGGERFLTLYETRTSGDLYARAYQALRETRDARDRAFHARFRNPDRYTLAWVGPELAGAMEPLAPCLHVDRFDLPAQALTAFNAWFVDRYLPACAGIDGLLRVRRFLTMEGRFAHLVVHEFAGEDALSRDGWTRARADAMWTQAVPRASAAYRRVIEAHAVTAAA